MSKSRNPNTPTEIRKRIASLKKQIAKKKRIAKLLQEESFFRDALKR